MKGIEGFDICKVTIDDVIRLPNTDIDHPFKYAFAYTISIHNISELFSIQILSRKWIISDGDFKDRIVDGERVVGLAPVILSNQIFTYKSYHVMQTSFGEASGFFLGCYCSNSEIEENIYKNERQELAMRNGLPFYVRIPTFKLIAYQTGK